MTQREAFNNLQVTKVDKSYKVPEGPVVSWNDIALHFMALVDEHAKNNSKGNKLERQDALVVHDLKGYKKTKLGNFYGAFSPYLKCAIIDGRMALLQRGDFVAEKMSDINLPDNLRSYSEEGHYISVNEIKRVLGEYYHDFVQKDEDLKRGYEQFSTLLNTILTKCTDYSAIGLNAVNKAAPQDKLQNTPLRRYQNSQPALRGGGMRECM